MNSETLIQVFDYNAKVIRNQLHDISHEESLMQHGEDGHSINWLLGHIVSSRSVPLQRLGAAPVWTEAQRSRYRNGSAPIGRDEPDVLSLPALLALFHQTQDRLVSGLRCMSVDWLSQPSGHENNNMFESFLYFHFHETYHIGQLTMVAAYLGRPAAYL